jgi:DNA-binding NarL/FixJ family response regulator
VTGTVLSSSRQASEAILLAGPSADCAEVLDLLSEEGLEATVADGREGLVEACFEHRPPAIVLISQGSTAPSWSSTLAIVREHASASRVVLVCTSIEGWEVRSALAAGAAGIVLADDAVTALGPCLAAVLAGQICVPQGNRQVVERPVLSAREKQILGLVVMGYMNGQIAEQLFLAESTVKSHLSSAFAKLGVRSRYEAVDLILDPERGLALGILALGGEPLDQRPSTGS